MLIEIERQLEGPTIPTVELESYGRKACQLPNRTLACTYALGTDPDGRWAVFREPAPASRLELDDLRRRNLSVSDSCSIAVSLADALAALHDARLRGCRAFHFDGSAHLTTGNEDSELHLLVRVPTPDDVFASWTASCDAAVFPADDSYRIGLLVAELLSMPDAPDAANESERTLLAFNLKARRIARTDVPDELAAGVQRALASDPDLRPSLGEWSSLLRRLGGAVLPKPDERPERASERRGELLIFRTVVSKLDRPLAARVVEPILSSDSYSIDICLWETRRARGSGAILDPHQFAGSPPPVHSALSETSFDTAPDSLPSSVPRKDDAPIRPASTALPIVELLTPPTIDRSFEPFASPFDSVTVTAPRVADAKEEGPPAPSIPEFPPSLDLPDDDAPLSQAPPGNIDDLAQSMQDWRTPVATPGTPRAGRRRHGHITRWGTLVAAALVLIAASLMYRQAGGGTEQDGGAVAPAATSRGAAAVPSGEDHFPTPPYDKNSNQGETASLAAAGSDAGPGLRPPDQESKSSESRRLLFPETRSIGLVFVRPADSRDARDWKKWSDARGEVLVNPGVGVLLVVDTADLSPLERLDPNAIDALQINNPTISDVDTDYIRRFTSLKALDIRNTKISIGMASKLESSLPGCVVLK